MTKQALLLQRLDEIGASLAQTGQALALLGLGSVGEELHRLDEYSDLDFFAIVKDGYKARFIDNLDWLSAIQPIGYAFQNTRDGHKLLFTDGVFCEFAVFEAGELAGIQFAPGRVVWAAADFDVTLLTPQMPPAAESHPVEWMLGEALTNVYVGLSRYHRGEKLAAARFVQQYAVSQILALSPHIATESGVVRDPYADERRYEARFPALAEYLPTFMQGYDYSRESALAILVFLERHFDVNPHIAREIRALCG